MNNCPRCGCPVWQTNFCTACGAPLPRRRRRFTPLLVMAVMIAVSLTVYLLMPTGRTVPAGNSCFAVANGTLFFDESRYDGDGDLVIPQTVDGETVRVIGADCFSGCDRLTSITLPVTVVAIEDGAFAGCTGLRGIALQENLMVMGSGVFRDCRSLEAVRFSVLPQSLPADTFSGCDSLRYLFVPTDYATWKDCFDGFITPYTYVSCADGIFPQGGTPS